jgi:hypothetical protein
LAFDDLLIIHMQIAININNTNMQPMIAPIADIGRDDCDDVVPLFIEEAPIPLCVGEVVVCIGEIVGFALGFKVGLTLGTLDGAFVG